MLSTNLIYFPFCDLSLTPPAPEDASIEKPATLSSTVEETAVGVSTTTTTIPVVGEVVAAQVTTTTEVVAGSTDITPVDVVVPAKATMITEVVMEAEAKTANDAAEASEQGGGTSGHRAGKEVIADVPSGSQRTADAVITEEEEEEEEYLTSSLSSLDLLPLWDLPHSGFVIEFLTLKTFLIGGMFSMTSVSKRCGGTESRRSMN